MAPTDPWKRYLDAGLELTQLTRQRAEKVVRDLMKAGEVQRDEAQERVEELLERSRRTTEAVVDLVRDEVTKQLAALGLTSGRAAKAAKTAPATAKKATSVAAPAAKKATTSSSAAKKPAVTAKKATKKAAKKATKVVGTTKKATGAS